MCKIGQIYCGNLWEWPQDYGDVHECAVEAVNRKGISSQGRLSSKGAKEAIEKVEVQLLPFACTHKIVHFIARRVIPGPL